MPQSLLFSIARRVLPKLDVPAYTPPTAFPDFHSEKWISLDLETYDPDLSERGPGWRRGAYIVGVALQTAGWREYYPLRHADGPNCDPDKVIAWLRENFLRFRGQIIGANSNLYDMDGLQMAGVRAPNARFRDIQWAEPLLDEYADSYSLETLAQKYLGRGKLRNTLLEKYGPEYIRAFHETHPAYAREYALGDVDLPPLILEKQETELRKQRLWKLFELEARLTPMLLHMRQVGVRVDLEKAHKLNDSLRTDLDTIVHKMDKMAGMEININANEVLAKACDKLNIRYALTAKGTPSFKKPIGMDSQRWIDKQPHEFLKLLFTARMVEKTRRDFVEGAIKESINGRIHAQFHPQKRAGNEEGEQGTVSGRFSCTNPNLQQIPVRTEIGKKVRELYIPEEGMLWSSKDYSQIEYRFLVHNAYLCKCDGADIAQKRYNDDPNTDFHKMVIDMTGLERGPAKTINFMLVYGGQLRRFATTLGLIDNYGNPTPAAEDLWKQYHTAVPFAQQIFDIAAERASDKGFVTTILKRRARFELWVPRYAKRDEHYPPLPYEEAKVRYGDKLKRDGTYKALSRLLSGSAADLSKQAMVDSWEAGIWQAGILVPHIIVHDESNQSVAPNPDGQRALVQLTEIMQNAIPLKVPVLVGGSQGMSWASAK